VSVRATSGRAAERSGGAADEATRKTGRHAPRTPRATVTDPHITVVEGPEPVDPASLNAAVSQFVKWAIRALGSANPPRAEVPEAATAHLSADYMPSN